MNLVMTDSVSYLLLFTQFYS